MITRHDVQRLVEHPANGRPILSVFLDMSVTSDNKRTWGVYMNRWRAQHDELASDRPSHHREALGAAYESVQRWIETGFQEANKGLAAYAEVGGDWFEALQFPLPVESKAAIRDEPIVAPLVQVLDRQHSHGILLVDREHLRMLSVYLGQSVQEHEVRTQPYPAPHDVQRGGYSATDYQKRKAEEVRHFFKEFALEVSEFDRRYRPDDLVILGTEENAKNFLEFLPAPIREKVVHVAHAAIDAPASEVVQKLAPFFEAQRVRQEAATVDLLRERVREWHLAVSGVRETLERLQRGEVQMLVVARDLNYLGARCENCHFYLAARESACPYCGGDTRDGVELVEAMVRLAVKQDLTVRFAPADAMAAVHGVGALLKF